MIGNLAVIGSNQGISILLNIFYGPIVNAARGIAMQIQSAVIQLLSGFTTAMRPQIVKSYANDELTSMQSLVIRGTKLSFFLTLIIVVPIFINVDYLLGLWLKEVPTYTVPFTRLLLISALLASYRVSILSAVHATGDIKKFQIVEGILLLTIVPFAYIAIKFFGIPPSGVFLIYIIIEALTQFVRVYIVFPMIGLSFIRYIKSITLPTLLSVLPVLIISYLIYINSSHLSFKEFIVSSVTSVLLTVISVFIFGLTRGERLYILSIIRNFLDKKFNNLHS